MLISGRQETEYTRYYQTESERFHLLPPGIARDRIAPANAADIRKTVRATYHIPEDHLLLLMVGSGFKTKGLDRAIHSLASLSPDLQKRCDLFVIGKDDPRLYERLAQRLKVSQQIQFLGGRSDVPNFLLAGDVLLQPSYHENTGTAILEALAAGLPVLTVEACGYAHYVQAANAGVVLSAPFQQSEWNKELEKMLISPQRTHWGQNGLSFAKSNDIYSLPERAADYIEVIGCGRERLSA
jgi:UDP-glucose:(heptosyl)LPS alpha-1,3-glucosyltransferase